MAKDPAFLFYPGDWISGTMYLDFECKGAYMELLMLQFNKGHMTDHMIKHVLGHKYDHIWPLISDKFQHEDGKYWNNRLAVEKEKRIKFSESRRKNKMSSKDMTTHMKSHMENEDILSIITRIRELTTVEEPVEDKFFVMLVLKMIEAFKKANPKYPMDKEMDYSACLQIAYRIAAFKKWRKADVVNGRMDECLSSWQNIIEFVKNDTWLCTRSLSDLNNQKEWQRLIQKMAHSRKKEEPKSDAAPLSHLPKDNGI